LGGLAERRAPELARLIGDKRYFAAWGAERGLPTLPVLATFESGAPVGRSADEVAEGLPAIDLFAKPADLWSGQGTRRWRVAAGLPQRWLDEQGQEIGAPEIVSALAAQSLERPLVLQRCLHTHPDMVLLAPDAVSTVRCVTCEDLDGVPRLLGAGIRIPMPGMIVDNMNAGGMVASIDMETGRLSQGIVRREHGMPERSSTLRGSATQLEGQDIALWPEVRRIALEAQRAAGLPFVGWDIALCAGGPILLEANIRWGGALLTFGSLSPLTDTDFPAVYMHHWARGPGARGPGQEP